MGVGLMKFSLMSGRRTLLNRNPTCREFRLHTGTRRTRVGVGRNIRERKGAGGRRPVGRRWAGWSRVSWASPPNPPSLITPQRPIQICLDFTPSPHNPPSPAPPRPPDASIVSPGRPHASERCLSSLCAPVRPTMARCRTSSLCTNSAQHGRGNYTAAGHPGPGGPGSAVRHPFMGISARQRRQSSHVHLPITRVRSIKVASAPAWSVQTSSSSSHRCIHAQPNIDSEPSSNAICGTSITTSRRGAS